VDAIKQRQHLVKAEFEIALQLATELDLLFENGDFDERQLLCETLFKRIKVKEGKIEDMDYNSPFGFIASQAKGWGTVVHGGPFATRYANH